MILAMKSPTLLCIKLLMIIFCIYDAIIAAKKANRLVVMAEIPFYEVRAGDARVCRVAMQIVADAVNRRNDILKDYYVEVDFEDEDRNEGNLAVRQLFTLQQRFLDQPLDKTNRTYQSPVVVGPRSSYGCKSFARIVDNLNMVGITYGCSSDFFTADRIKYPNLYRTRLPGELVGFSFLAFIQKVGKWKQIGLLGSAAVLDYSMLNFFYQIAYKYNLKLTWFDIVQNITPELLIPLKKSDARVIAVFVNGADNIVSFLCNSYKLGVTGSRYIFLAMVSAFNDPNKMPNMVAPNCTKRILLEQMKYTLWLGGLSFGLDHDHTSTLGHSLDSLDILINNITNGNNYADYHRRHQCYDAMLQTVMTLDLTEKQLVAKNMSLRDYKSKPVEVMKVANSSAGMVEYTGLRFGKTKYSERLELDNEPQYVTVWSPEMSSLDVVYEIACKPGGSVMSLDDYVVNKIHAISWQTADGQPPKSHVLQNFDVDDVSIESFSAVVTLSAVLTTVQLFALIFSGKYNRGQDWWPFTKFLVSVGCMLLNIASICFSVKFGEGALTSCYFARIGAALGLSTVHGSLLSQISVLRGAKQTQAIELLSHSISEDWLAQFFTAKGSKKMAFKLLALALLPVVVVMVLWFSMDPLKSDLLKLTPVPIYNAEEDIYLTTLVNTCFSSREKVWMLVIAGILVLPLLAASYWIYEIKHSPSIIKALSSFKWTSFAILNSLTIFAGALLVMAILQSTTTRYIAASYCLLLFSVTTTGFIFGPFFWKGYKNIKRRMSPAPTAR